MWVAYQPGTRQRFCNVRSFWEASSPAVITSWKVYFRATGSSCARWCFCFLSGQHFSFTKWKKKKKSHRGSSQNTSFQIRNPLTAPSHSSANASRRISSARVREDIILSIRGLLARGIFKTQERICDPILPVGCSRWRRQGKLSTGCSYCNFLICLWNEKH